MQSYVIMSGFRQKVSKKGRPYGMHVAALSTPETKWGHDHVSSAYNENPEKSFDRITAQVKKFFPDAEDSCLRKVLGYRR